MSISQNWSRWVKFLSTGAKDFLTPGGQGLLPGTIMASLLPFMTYWYNSFVYNVPLPKATTEAYWLPLLTISLAWPCHFLLLSVLHNKPSDYKLRICWAWFIGIVLIFGTFAYGNASRTLQQAEYALATVPWLIPWWISIPLGICLFAEVFYTNNRARITPSLLIVVPSILLFLIVSRAQGERIAYSVHQVRQSQVRAIAERDAALLTELRLYRNLTHPETSQIAELVTNVTNGGDVNKALGTLWVLVRQLPREDPSIYLMHKSSSSNKSLSSLAYRNDTNFQQANEDRITRLRQALIKLQGHDQ